MISLKVILDINEIGMVNLLFYLKLSTFQYDILFYAI